MIVRIGWFIRICEKIAGMSIGAITLFPFIILSERASFSDKRLINHEKIHIRQQIELLILPFYIWYVIEYFLRGYRGISFEKEAYANDHDLDYLKKRKIFAFLAYL